MAKLNELNYEERELLMSAVTRIYDTYACIYNMASKYGDPDELIDEAFKQVVQHKRNK